jgi:uncharacterized membrane protein YoaK (UPF0700 family)
MTHPDEGHGPAGRRAQAIRDLLVGTLTLTTGAVDATTFLVLGKVFSSVITGNLVLVGVAAGTMNATEAIHGAVALAAYALGVLVGAPIAALNRSGHGGRTDPAGAGRADPPGRAGRADEPSIWPAPVTLTLLLELCLLAGFSAGWELSPYDHRGAVQLPLLILLAASMGMQSAAVRRLGQMSSTYLTSTLTGLMAGLATRTKPDRVGRSVGVLLGIVVGAIVAAVLVRQAPTWLPAPILAPMIVAICTSAGVFGLRGPRGPRSPRPPRAE